MCALPFSVFIGEQDSGRISSAREGIELLKAVKQRHAEHYTAAIDFKSYPGAGHSLPDAAYQDVSAYFQQHKRITYPKAVHWAPQVQWKKRFYNLQIDEPKRGMSVNSSITDNTITLSTQSVKEITVLLNDKLLDLDKPVTVILNGVQVYNAIVLRRFGVLLKSIHERPDSVYYASLQLKTQQ